MIRASIGKAVSAMQAPRNSVALPVPMFGANKPGTVSSIGVISAAMLGLGRALGETIAVTIILSTLPDGAKWTFSLLNGGETFASRIANNAAEFDTPQKAGAFIAAGLVLFILTFVVNAIARIVIDRRKAFSE